MVGGERVPDSLQKGPHQPLREGAVGPSGAVGIEPARQQIEADEEHLLRSEVASAVERFLVGARLRHIGFGPLAHVVFAESLLETVSPARVDCRIEHVRAGRDDLRQPRRRAENVAEQFAQVRVRTQDRQEFD